MKSETLNQIIEQIKKYELTESFSNVEDFIKWFSKLNSLQINNFIRLKIDLEEIRELRQLLINSNLLNCKDYIEKVVAISKLKNCCGCWHLCNNICKPNFLNSKNFYKDIEMLSKADTARYGLWILGEDTFINSPYHDEDLKLLVETHDKKKYRPLDFIISDALATVACNIDSIRSPYHQADMKLIASSGSDCLQMSHAYPEHSLNNLAINKVSLADKYHLENMQILAKNHTISKFLYIIMTDPDFVKGKNYRKEIEALINAKSKVTARALYYYIVNPEKKYLFDVDFFDDYEYHINDAQISDINSVAGRNDRDYLNNLIKINEINDSFVMYFVSLLMNPNFINSFNKKFDLEILQNVEDKSIFMDLYRLMMNDYSIYSSHHKRDVVIISQIKVEDIRKLLLEKATDKLSLNSDNHDYDMEYISKLNLDSIDKTIYNEIYYYLFTQKGIDDSQHKIKLEKLLQGELVKRSNSLSKYLEYLQNQIDNSNLKIDESAFAVNYKTKSKILSLFKKNKRK